MSKLIEYPNGYKGTVSDAVAAVLAKRPGHKILDAAPPPPPKKPKKDKE